MIKYQTQQFGKEQDKSQWSKTFGIAGGDGALLLPDKACHKIYKDQEKLGPKTPVIEKLKKK